MKPWLIIVIVLIACFLAFFLFVNMYKSGSYLPTRNTPACEESGGICREQCNEDETLMKHFEGERICPEDLVCCSLRTTG